VVITAAPKPLNVHIGAPVARLRNQYSPAAVFLVGIAGGRKGKISRGDVVIAQRVFYPEPEHRSKSTTAVRPQWAESFNAYGNGLYSYDPRETEYYSRVREFTARLSDQNRPPNLRTDHEPQVFRSNTTIAAGETVYRDGAALEQLAVRFDDTIRAVDQESYGFADAVRDLPWAVFRGISDLADEVKDDRWKYPVSGFAALCARDFLENSFVPPDTPDF
jgi:nucleoside phosphorylase